MQELNLDTQDQKVVKLEGQIYQVRPLKVRDQMEMLKELQSNDGNDLEISFKYLARCGLPQEKLYDLDGEQLESLVEFLNVKKKK